MAKETRTRREIYDRIIFQLLPGELTYQQNMIGYYRANEIRATLGNEKSNLNKIVGSK